MLFQHSTASSNNAVASLVFMLVVSWWTFNMHYYFWCVSLNNKQEDGWCFKIISSFDSIWIGFLIQRGSFWAIIYKFPYSAYLLLYFKYDMLMLKLHILLILSYFHRYYSFCWYAEQVVWKFTLFMGDKWWI